MAAMNRIAEERRTTKETSIAVELNLDGTGQSEIDTGVGFLDHMLVSLAFWARFDLELRCEGDLRVDDHHTVEDCALALGAAFDRALGERIGIARFGNAYAPMDDALARAVVDLSGRPYCVAELGTKREALGDLSLENVPHFFASFALKAGANLHVDVLRGANDHHRVEAAFKATGLALRAAINVESDVVPSTKGVL